MLTITLDELANTLGEASKSRGFMLALAESCTGGMVAQAITSVAGSSEWFDRGFVTYSNAAKIDSAHVLVPLAGFSALKLSRIPASFVAELRPRFQPLRLSACHNE